MQRRRLSDPVRLPDGTIVTIKDGLADGRLLHAPLWFQQRNETAGNIVGLAPQWRKSACLSPTIEHGVAAVRNYEKANPANRGEMRLLGRMVVSLPDDGGDYCYTSQKAIEGDEALKDELARYGSVSPAIPTEEAA